MKDPKVTINREAVDKIMSMCEMRDFSCTRCPYSIKRAIPSYKGYACCIFSNVPRDWSAYEDIGER